MFVCLCALCAFVVMSRPISSTTQFVLRCSLTLGSLFTGASIVHTALKPDLTLPKLETEAPPTPVHIEGFSPSATFAGARKGFVFKSGPAGIGYYPDSSGK